MTMAIMNTLTTVNITSNSMYRNGEKELIIHGIGDVTWFPRSTSRCPSSISSSCCQYFVHKHKNNEVGIRKARVFT